MSFKIDDRPMGCCGMVMGSNFSTLVFNDPVKRTGARYSNREDWTTYFKQLEEWQRDVDRNCSMISLSSDQLAVKEVAEKEGYRVIQEFFNPNSGNQVYLMTKVLWEDRAAWKEDHIEDEDEEE